MLLQEAVNDFLLAGDQRGLSKGMMYLHRRYLNHLRQWLEARNVIALEDLTRRMLREWGKEIRVGRAPATVHNAVRSVRQFLRWCADEDLIVDLSNALSMVRVPQRIQRTVTPSEVGRILSVCDTEEDTVKGKRNAAIVCLLFDSLLRASEFRGLRVCDLDIDCRRLIVIDGKAGEQRIATFGDLTAARLTAWLEVRPSGSDALFVNVGKVARGKPLVKKSFENLVSALAKAAEVPHLTAHAFRRGGACELVRQNIGTRGVMAKGGWRTLQQVERYTRALQLELLCIDANPMDGVYQTA